VLQVLTGSAVRVLTGLRDPVGEDLGEPAGMADGTQGQPLRVALDNLF
jgi:hypothetical protein